MALNASAIQYGIRGSADASLAVDGDLSTASCSGTVNQSWWSVDLGSSGYITGVQVTNDGSAIFCKHSYVPIFFVLFVITRNHRFQSVSLINDAVFRLSLG